MNRLSEFIKDYRQRKGLTQSDLANKLGVHSQYISNIERGRGNYTVTFTLRMMGILTIPDRKLLKEAVMCDQGDRLDKLLKFRG